MSEYKKKVPSNIGIFGASGHIGAAMTRWLRFRAPHVQLRLISSNEQKAAELRAEYPGCEVVTANYYDLPSMTAAVAGMEGLFVNTPGSTHEEPAMANLIAALGKSGSLIHMIRTVGMFPSIGAHQIPEALKKRGYGLETQHPLVRRMLDDAGVPVTYFNLGASFMDNPLIMPMLSRGKFTWPNRRVPYIDPREIGEAAARILLDDNSRHIYQFHTLNNGAENFYMNEVVDIMSDVLQVHIEYDSSREGFFGLMGPLLSGRGAPPDMVDYLWDFFRYEDANDVAWSLNDFLERTLGRKPNTVRSWMREHRTQLLARLQ